MQIQVEVCKTDVHRYCEKFSNIFPFPVEEQNCHFEPKKICELEMKTRPKKAKKYSYTKDSKELKKLGLQPLKFDPATFVKFSKGKLEVAYASHVDDCLVVGDKEMVDKTHTSMSQQLQY